MECPGFTIDNSEDIWVAVPDEKSSSIYFLLNQVSKKIEMNQADFLNFIEKPEGGRPKAKIIWSSLQVDDALTENIVSFYRDGENTLSVSLGNVTENGDTEPDVVGKPGDYDIFLNDDKLTSVTMKQGANYNLLILGNETVIHQESIQTLWLKNLTLNLPAGDTREQCQHVLANSSIFNHDNRRDFVQCFNYGVLLHTG